MKIIDADSRYLSSTGLHTYQFIEMADHVLIII